MGDVSASIIHPQWSRQRVRTYGSITRVIGTEKLRAVLSSAVDTVSRRRGRMPARSRIASDAKAGGNAPDMLTEAR